MGTTKQQANNNDYAVARELHDGAIKLLGAVTQLNDVYNYDDPYAEYHEVILLLNRPYVLLVHELEKLYGINKTLAKLNEEPKTKATWTLFNTIESSDQDINLYLREHKNTEDFAHLAQVNRLSIIAGKETADFTPEQQKIIDEADKAFITFVKKMGEWSARRPKKKSKGYHFIMNYKLKYEVNGSIVINDVLVLKKTQSGSAPRKLMEQALKHPYELFKPELGQLNRNLSSVLSDMGITGTLKELFFPIANKDGVKFRPSVNYTTAEEERIDTKELDKKLKVLGAETATILDNNISEEPLDEETRAFLAAHPETRVLLEEHELNEKERKNP
ncbi:MAG TPA: hypothetical protein VJR27_04575 [Candidatus Saccharimonadales bacterium]|nr:hypothetical protein [Candidatus Saccharimonadales bacterium]